MYAQLALSLASLLLCVLINAFFVASEYCLVSVRQSRIQELVDDGDSRALVVQKLQKCLSRSISGTQFGSTLASLWLGWYGEGAMQHLVADGFNSLGIGALEFSASASFALAFLLLTLVTMVLGEQLPKLVSLNMAETVALRIARPFSLYCLAVLPVIWLLDRIVSLVMTAAGIDRTAVEHGTIISQDEFEILIKQSEASGGLSERQTDMLEGVLKLFGDYSVDQAMVPREKVDCIAETATLHELIAAVARTKHSKLPVYRGSIDNIVGIMNTKDLFDLWVKSLSPNNVAHQVGFTIHKWMRPVYKVPQDTKASTLLDDLRKRRIQMAIVVDSEGKTLGMVAMEDVLERIVGEIYDEHDKPGKPAASSKPETDRKGTSPATM